MNREFKLAGATLVLSTTSSIYAQPASAPSNGASVPMSGNPAGQDVWSVAIVGGAVGGAVAGVIVAVVVVSQLKKSLGAASSSQR